MAIIIDCASEAREHLAECDFCVTTTVTENTERQCDFDGAFMTRTSKECWHGVLYKVYTCPREGCDFRKHYGGRAF